MRPPAATAGDSADESGSADETGGGDSTTVAPPTTDSGDDEGEDSAAPPKYDINAIPDAPEFPCAMGGGTPLSYIWIANSQQGTISKINTETVEEEGRYYAKASGGDPSRTSVNLNGNVAVANRNGGVAKFWSNPAHCVDSNGEPGIQTSTGSGEVLPFGEDDCMAWYTAMSCGTNRPVAWTRGYLHEATCRYEDAKLWTSCDNEILLLDGDTGEIEESVPTGGSYAYLYGGAADANGNFWAIDFGDSYGLLRVDYETLELTQYPLPNSGAYGITVDSEGRPWVCSQTVARFNLDDETWSEAAETTYGGGCMFDGESRVWHGGGGWGGGGGSSMYGFDIDSMDLEKTLSVPNYVHGVSIDAAGNVWGVEGSGTNAYRVDPETEEVTTFSGLVGAYTYSDMTGIGLEGAGGGGTPSG